MDFIGWFGAAALLAAYALHSAGRLRPGLVYQLLNLTGALGLAASAAHAGAYPPAALNVFWAAVAAVALARLATRPPSAEGAGGGR